MSKCSSLESTISLSMMSGLNPVFAIVKWVYFVNVSTDGSCKKFKLLFDICLYAAAEV